MSAVPHLSKQLKDLQKHPLGGFRVEVGTDIYTWTVWFAGPRDTPYYPGVYRAQLTFPQEFPFKPPELKILSSFWHPNVYDTGVVCISVLHAPGVDEHNSIESAQMRWTPVQTIEKVLVAFVSLLSDPDASDAGAPANVDALVQHRKDRNGYVKKCQDLAKKALSELPADFVPLPENDAPPDMPARGMSAYASNSEAFFDDEPADAPSAAAASGGGGGGGGGGQPYAAELTQIREMGLGEDRSDEFILDLLSKFKGDLERTIDRLS